MTGTARTRVALVAAFLGLLLAGTEGCSGSGRVARRPLTRRPERTIEEGAARRGTESASVNIAKAAPDRGRFLADGPLVDEEPEVREPVIEEDTVPAVADDPVVDDDGAVEDVPAPPVDEGGAVEEEVPVPVEEEAKEDAGAQEPQDTDWGM